MLRRPLLSSVLLLAAPTVALAQDIEWPTAE